MSLRLNSGLLAILFVLLGASRTHAWQADDVKLERLLAQVTPDAQVVVAIPSLKRLNDDITELFGGMDRADLVAGGRPIDLAKSALGLGGGIDDRRGAAIMILPGEDAAPASAILLPVVEPDTFLSTNFKHDDATGAYIGSRGEAMWIAQLEDNYMLLSDEKRIVDHYAAGNGSLEHWRKRFGDSANAFFTRGEVLVMLNQDGARFVAQNLDQFAPGMQGMTRGAGAQELEEKRDAVLKQLDALGYVVDVDPLGVMVHGLVTFQPESELAAALHAPSALDRTWPNNLSGKPFYFAAGADLKAAGAMEALETMAAVLDINLGNLREMLGGATRISFIASPSPAGLAGGMLNDAALVVHAENPKAMHAQMRSAIDQLVAKANTAVAAQAGANAPDAGPAFDLSWTDNKTVGDEKIIADSYEIRGAGSDMMLAMMRSTIFGQSQRGFLATTDRAVVMTFSTRPAVLKAAVDAANGTGETLANDALLASVARWIGSPAPIELFISLGQINKFATTVAKSFGPMGEGIDLPELDPKGPPMALQFGVGDRSMTSTLALPAPLLADILREAEKAMRPFTGADMDAQ